MSRAKLRGLPLFWILLGVYAAALFGSIVLGLNILTDRLIAYEAKQPDGAATAVFDEFFANGLDRAIEDYCPRLSPFETKEMFAQALKASADGKMLAWKENGTDANGTRHFDVTADNEFFAQFTLSPAENGVWQLDGITFALTPTEDVTVTVYGGGSVKINGIELTEDCETGRDYSHSLNSLIPLTAEGAPMAESIYTVTYQAEGLFLPPEVTATDRGGRDCPLTENEDGSFTARLIYDDDRLEEVSERVLSAAEEYCRYMYRDASLTDIAIYISRESELYSSLRDLEQFWSEDGEKREFSEGEVSELYFFNEEIITCRVKTDASLGEDTDAIDMTLIFLRPGRAWMLERVIIN